METTDPRLVRHLPERAAAAPSYERHPDYRADLERIRFSPYFSRLSAVTQVISQADAGLVVHNRLTHSIKVTAVARAMAVRLASETGERAALIARLGGCAPVVVQAAASSHDLGHPPFGHLGERTLDRLAQERFGLREGFEGNAQTFRILTRLDEYERAGAGLNLTAAVRAGVLKYPWLRTDGEGREPGPSTPRGLAPVRPGELARKCSAYAIDAAEMTEALAAYPNIGPMRQTLECSVMDIADDIAYSLHDLDDFYRAGLLGNSSVPAEFHEWRRRRVELRALDPDALAVVPRPPGFALEALWRELWRKDPWIADPDAFDDAVRRVGEEVVDGLLAVPFDGSIPRERSLTLLTSSWIAHLEDSINLVERPDVRSGHVHLDTQAWHEVAVLKFIHEHFILNRPDLAVYQRGQATVLERLVLAFADWLADPDDRARVPRRLIDLVEFAHADSALLAADDPDAARAAGVVDAAALDRLAMGRGIIDYVASLTDAQATSLSALISGASERIWEAGQGL